MQPLNRKTANLPRQYPEKVVQFGGGNFLRAFADWMIGEMNDSAEFNGSVVVVKAAPKSMFTEPYDALAAQNGLYHLVLTGVEDGVAQSTTTLESSISRVINPYRNFNAFLALARQPEIRFIISNTTEAGIIFDDDNLFNDDPPANFPAKVTRFLYERFKHFDGSPTRGCIILPVELIEANGANLLRCVRAYCALWELEPEFEYWLTSANVFCNTLVDRIVPGFPHDRADAIREEVGYDDALLVEGEQYHSWVIEAPDWIENEFPTSEAGLNVKFVDDVTPYRDLKVRILNGAHTSMVPVGYLYGLRTVRETVEDEVLGKFIAELLFDEVLPTLSASHAEREQMAHDVLNRFRNPYLKHELLTISLNSTSKFVARVLPSLLTYVELFGRPPLHLTLAFAALIRFYKGEWHGEPIPVQDAPDTMAWWQSIWSAEMTTEQRVAAILSNDDVWGLDLTTVPDLAELVCQYLDMIEAEGMGTVLETVYA
jgi:tagaturonate reductase